MVNGPCDASIDKDILLWIEASPGNDSPTLNDHCQGIGIPVVPNTSPDDTGMKSTGTNLQTLGFWVPETPWPIQDVSGNYLEPSSNYDMAKLTYWSQGGTPADFPGGDPAWSKHPSVMDTPLSKWIFGNTSDATFFSYTKLSPGFPGTAGMTNPAMLSWATNFFCQDQYNTGTQNLLAQITDWMGPAGGAWQISPIPADSSTIVDMTEEVALKNNNLMYTNGIAFRNKWTELMKRAGQEPWLIVGGSTFQYNSWVTNGYSPVQLGKTIGMMLKCFGFKGMDFNWENPPGIAGNMDQDNPTDQMLLDFQSLITNAIDVSGLDSTKFKMTMSIISGIRNTTSEPTVGSWNIKYFQQLRNAQHPPVPNNNGYKNLDLRLLPQLYNPTGTLTNLYL